MRILICNYEYPPLGGGGGVLTAQLAQELAENHEVTVLTMQGQELPAESIENGVRVVRAPVVLRRQEATASLLSMLTFMPSGIRVGKRLLKAEKFDVINTHFVLPSGPVGDWLARFGRLPNVLTVHGGDLYDPTKFTSPHRHALLRIWVRKLVRRADRVVGQSNNTLDNLRRFYTPKTQPTRIPLGIQRPAFAPAARARYGFPENAVLLVTVGRLVPRKAVNQLIALVQALNNDKAHLLVVGEGPQEQLLKEECLRRCVEGRVTFLGHVGDSEKFQLLQMSDIYVSTSQHEGFGLVFLEAMHCGLPIVCYDYGGQTDFLLNGVTGFLVPLNNQNLFRERCKLLIQDPEARKKMGENNKLLVREFYIDQCASRYEAVFQEAVAAHASKSRVWSIGTKAG